MKTRPLSDNTVFFDELGSTNEEMNRLLLREDHPEGFVIRTGFQSAGKGHQDNKWSSQPGMNLLFSILLEPGFLLASEAFQLSRIVSLSLLEVLDRHDIKAQIKWPNDIYTVKGKIAGILIENSITGKKLNRCIAGIGLNVNQTEFDDWIPSPTSMKIEAGCHFDMNELLSDFRGSLGRWYDRLASGAPEEIDKEYLENLYLFGVESSYRSGSETFVGRISNVLASGELVISRKDGSESTYGFKEIEYISG